MLFLTYDKTFTKTKNALTLTHEFCMYKLLHFNENGKHSLRNSTVTVYLGGSKLSCYSIIRKVPTSQVFCHYQMTYCYAYCVVLFKKSKAKLFFSAFYLSPLKVREEFQFGENFLLFIYHFKKKSAAKNSSFRVDRRNQR